MKTVKQLTKDLDLETVHQTRNRIKAVQDIISEYVRRGENNELLVSDDGVAILRRLQDLYESGLLLSEAAEVIRTEGRSREAKGHDRESKGIEGFCTSPNNTELVDYLREEVDYLRELVRRTGKEPQRRSCLTEKPDHPWWEEWL